MEEANGFRALLHLEEPKYSIEQIAAKTGKSPVYVAARLRLTELSQTVVDAFYREEIGVGHALLLAKLQALPPKSESSASKSFRHSGITAAFKTMFDVFTSVGPDNSLERLTERSVGLATGQTEPHL